MGAPKKRATTDFNFMAVCKRACSGKNLELRNYAFGFDGRTQHEFWGFWHAFLQHG